MIYRLLTDANPISFFIRDLYYVRARAGAFRLALFWPRSPTGPNGIMQIGRKRYTQCFDEFVGFFGAYTCRWIGVEVIKFDWSSVGVLMSSGVNRPVQ